MKTIKTECPYCHQPDTLTIDDGVDIIEPVKRACPACWKKKMENVNIEKSREPTCPSCGWGFRNFIDVFLEHDGDMAEITCTGCGVTFTTEISMKVTFCNKIMEIER